MNIRTNPRLFILSTGIAALLAAAPRLSATDYNFVPATGTVTWNDGANWTTLPADDTTFPSLAGDFANLIKDFTGNTTVNLNGDISLGRLDVGDTTAAQTLTINGTGGTRTITFDATSGNALLTVGGAGTGQVTLGSSLILALADNLTLTRGAKTLQMDAAINLGANTVTIGAIGTGSVNFGTATSTANLVTGTGGFVVTQGTFGGFSSFGGANTFSGGVTLNSGNMALLTSSVGTNGSVTSGGFGTGTLTINGGLIRATSTAPNSRTMGNGVVFGGNFTIGEAATTTGLIMAGDVTLTGDRTITVAGGGTAADLTTRHTIAGVIGDQGNGFSFTKTGTGTLVFTGVNTYSGATSVLNGALVLGGNAPSGVAGTLGNSTSAVSLGGAGSAAANNVSLLVGVPGASPGAATITVAREISVGSVNSTGATAIGTLSDTDAVFSGNITLAKNVSLQSLSTSAGRAATFTGEISGGFGVTKTGAGAVRLSGVNTYTTFTTVRAGTLLVAADVTPFVAGPVGNSADLIRLGDAQTAAADNPTLSIDGAFTIARDVTVAANAGALTTVTATNAAATTATYSGIIGLGRNAVLANATSGATTRFTGPFNDALSSFGVTINGPGTVEFANTTPQAFNGVTTVASGTLLLNATANLGTGGGAIIGDANTATADVAITGGTLLWAANHQIQDDAIIQLSGGSLNLAGFTETIFDLDYTGGAIINAGNLTISNGTDLFLFDGTNIAANTTLNRNLLYVGSTTQGTVSAAELRLDSDPVHGISVNDGAAAVDLLISANIVNDTTATTITKRGNGVLKLTGANTFGGVGQTVTIEGGALAVTADNQLGHAANTITFTGGALRFDSAFALTRTLNLTASGGGIDTPTGVTVTLNTPGQFAGVGNFAKRGSGTLVLSADQSGTWTGGTTILEAGTLQISAENQLGAGTNDVTFQGGTLRVTSGFVASAGKVFTLGAGSLSVDANQTLTIPGTGGLVGNTVLTKTGAGTLAITSTNAGLAAGAGVNVAAGILEIQQSQSLGDTAKASVTLSGGTLNLRNDVATTFNNPVTVTANSTVTSDVLANGNPGVTHTLGALSLGAAKLTAGVGSNVTGGAPIVAFSSTALTANGTLAANAGGRLNSGAVALGTNKLTIDGAGIVNLNGVISGGPGAGLLAIEKNGTGTAISSTISSTFIGDVAINAGIYQLSGSGALGNTANVIKVNGGTLLHSAGAPAYAIQFNGGTLAQNGGNRDWNAQPSANGPSITFTADTTFNVEDPTVPGSLNDINFGSDPGTTGVPTSIGPVNLTINAPSANATAGKKVRFRQRDVAGSVTGTVTINDSAIFQMRGLGAINGFGSSTMRLGTGINLTTNTQSGRLELAAAGGTTFGNNVEVLSDSTIGLFQILGGSNALFTLGNLAIGNQTLVIANGSGNYDLEFTGTTTLSGDATLHVGSTGSDLTLNAVTQSTAAGLTKSGAGLLRLNGPLSYTGTTTMNAGTLDFGIANQTIGAFNVVAGIVNGTGILTTTGVTADAGTINVALAGTGGLVKNSAGVLTLGAVNTFSGDVTVNGGTVNMTVDNALPDTANVLVTGGLLNFNSGAGTNRSDTIASLTMTGGQVRTVNGTATTTSLVTITGTLDVSGFGDFQVNSGSSVSANKVIFSGETQNLHVVGGNSDLQVNELIVGAGGMEFTGTNLRMNLGDTPTRMGSRVVLNGNVTSFASFNESGFYGSSAPTATNGVRQLDIGSGNRIFTIADGDALNDFRVDVDIVGDGTLVKEGDGTLALNGLIGTGTTSLAANDGVVTIAQSQTLEALVIGAGATVVLVEDFLPAPAGVIVVAEDQTLAPLNIDDGGTTVLDDFGVPIAEWAPSGFEDSAGVAAVPEPGVFGLMAAGALGILSRRRRRSL